MARVRRTICVVDGCHETARSKDGLGLCQNCYHGLWYWLQKRSVKAIVDRQGQLNKLVGRMKFIRDAYGSPSKVRTRRKKVRTRA